jgi:hypothetical protein
MISIQDLVNRYLVMSFTAVGVKSPNSVPQKSLKGIEPERLPRSKARDRLSVAALHRPAEHTGVDQ